ncbi:MAG TPA: FtsX-like permease family protein [Ohtaekwangia sp.]|nr:FtsX-like permease family protein [Ohtaekwangia sp.]
MKLSFFIARRYLVSKRKKNFINVISWLSMTGVAFITAALVIVLSVFNGLEDLLHSLNNSFDPEIKIEAAKGKSFEVTPDLIRKIEGTQGVRFVTEVIEDYAYLRYRTESNNQVVTLKGVSENFIEQNRIPDANIVEGELALQKNGINYAIIGNGVKYSLSIAVGDNMFPLQVFYIKNARPGADPSQLYSKMNILAGGVFSIVQQFDENYVIVPLEFARDLLNYGDRRTAIEVKTDANANIFDVERRLQTVLGNEFNVLNHEEQHKDIYRLLKIEKLFTFLSFSVLLGIGSINIFFSLMMLALDKKRDISILAAMGAAGRTIRNIFLFEGALIAAIGACSGLVLGAAFCLLQERYAFISMGMENAVMDGYPIKMRAEDFVWTLTVVSVITFLISIRPAVLASRTASVQHL